MVPKDLTQGKKYRTLSDFIEANAALIQQWGFDVDLVGLMADLQRNYDNFAPGTVYSNN